MIKYLLFIFSVLVAITNAAKLKKSRSESIILQQDKRINVSLTQGASKTLVIKKPNPDHDIVLTAFPGKSGGTFKNLHFKAKNVEEQDFNCNIDRAYGFCILNPDEIKKALFTKTDKNGTVSDVNDKRVVFYMTCTQGPCDTNIQLTNHNNGRIHTESKEITFKDSEIQLVDVEIPETFQRIIVSLEFKNRKSKLDENAAQLENDELNILKKHIIDNHVIFEFRNEADQKDGCRDCDATIQLLSDSQTTVTTSVFYFHEEATDLIVDGFQLDSLQANKPQEYTFNLHDFDSVNYLKFSFHFIRENVNSQVILTGGKINDYGNQQTSFVSNSLEQAKKVKKQRDDEKNKEFSLVFRKDEIGSFSDSTFKFVVLSFVEEFGMIDISTHKEPILPILIDQIYTSSVETKKHDYYLFKSPNVAKLQEHKSVTILLSDIIGDSELLVKKLQYKDRFLESLPTQSDFIAQKTGQVSQITLDSTCSTEDEFCYFQIFVKNNDEIKVDYHLEVTYTNKTSLVQLKENQSFTDYVLAEDYKDYFFQFDNSKKDITHIDIRVNNELVQLFAAGKHECQEARPSCDKVRTGININPIIFEKPSSYEDGIVIAVKSQRPTDFHISVEVHRIKKQHFLELSDSHSMSAELTPQYPEKYFTFQANFDEEEDLIINLNAPANKAIIVVNNDGTIPHTDEKKGFQWISRNNYLRIKHTDSENEFKKKATYTIGIISTPGVFLKNNMDQHTPFKIMVSSCSSVKPLTMNEQFFDATAPENAQFYQIRINATEDRAAYISRNIMNDETVHDDLKFYIGNDIKQNMTEFQYVLKGEEQATFELTKEVLFRICGHELGPCEIYIGVKNFGKKEIHYSITTWEQSVALQLTEGLQYQYTLHHIDGYMNFYFVPTDRTSSLNFEMYSYFGLTNFTIKVFENQQNLPKDQWPFPNANFGIQEKDHTRKDIDYTSSIHHTHSITLTEEVLKKIPPGGIILISVAFMEQDEQSDKKQGNDQFKLLVSSNFMNIFPGERVEFTLENYESKYSFLPLSNILQRGENESVFLQLTSLSGKATIAVSIRDDLNDRIPIVDDNDLLTDSNYMELSPKDMKRIIKKKKLSLSANPTLVIQVQAWLSSGKFVLSATTDKSNQIDVLHGVPTEFHLHNDFQTISFRYYNYINEDIQIRISRDYGFGNFTVQSCTDWSDCNSNENSDGDDEKEQETDEEDDSEEEQSENENKTKNTNNNNGGGSEAFLSGQTGSFIEIKKDSSLWCKDCYFMITVQNLDHSEFHGFLYVLLDKDAIWLPEGRTIFDNNDKNESNLYRISVPSNEETTLSMMVYWGNPLVYVNYYYETDHKDFSQGPFKKEDNGQLHINIPARDDIMDQSSKSKKKKRQSQDLVLNENSFYSNLIENEIYILVVNPEKTKFQSNYSITYFAGEQEKYISDGHILPIVLESQETMNFIHQHYDTEAQAIISLNLKNYKEFDISHIEVSATLQEQESRTDTLGKKNQKAKIVDLQKFVSAKDHINYALPNKTGGYNIQITNNGHQKADLSIYINTRDITLVPLGHKIEHYLVEDSINYYEMIIPYKGYIAIYLQHCTGSLHYGYSQDYNKFVDHNFTDETAPDAPSLAGNTYLDLYEVKKGTFYLALYSNKEEGSLYTLKANFYKSKDDVPHHKLNAGQQGFVQVERNGQGSIYLEFSPIRCTQCSEQDLSKARVKYTVLWSTDQEIMNAMGVCGVTDFFDHKLKDMEKNVLFTNTLDPNHYNPGVKSKSFDLGLSAETRLNYTFPIQEFNATYYATIKAEVHNFPGSDEEIIVTYQPVQLEPALTLAERGGLQQDLMYLGAISLVIFVCLLVCLLCRRICRPAVKNARYNQQVDTEYAENVGGEMGNISILDKSSDGFNRQQQMETDFSAIPNTDRSLQQEQDQEFTFSKKIASDEGIKKFNKFEDDV